MSQAAPEHATLDEWIARESISFSLDAPETVNAAVDRIVGSLGDAVDVLGMGEALHGGEEILVLRNRLFRRLAEAHGYSAIAVESSFPRSTVVNEYVAGRGAGGYETVAESGFSHGFGRLEANRELVEWMRGYNANPAHAVKLRFYGFDSPTEMMGSDSPRSGLQFALDYLAAIGSAGVLARQQRIERLLGDDATWENPAAMMDPRKSIGLSPAATALRIEAEDLMTELRLRRADRAEKGDGERYLEAEQHAWGARQLLTYHASVARESSTRLVELLGIRDLTMADNLAYAALRERGRIGRSSPGGPGKVLAFAHNSHLKRGPARWQLGPHALEWWPAGAHLNATLGSRYAVIGSGVGVSEANGIGQPEPGTLEARLAPTGAGPSTADVRFIATHGGKGLLASDLSALPTRSASAKNPSYFALTVQSLTDFDALLILDSVEYTRGGPPLQHGGTAGTA